MANNTILDSGNTDLLDANTVFIDSANGAANGLIYAANTTTFAYNNYNPETQEYESEIGFTLSYSNYDHIYKEIYNQHAQLVEQISFKEGQISNILDSTAGHHELTEEVLEDITNTIGLLVANVENIKNSIILIQEDLAALEERAKRIDRGVVTRSAWWFSDCSRYGTNSRFRRMMMISTIENLKECGLYDDLVEEINNPTEV